MSGKKYPLVVEKIFNPFLGGGDSFKWMLFPSGTVIVYVQSTSPSRELKLPLDPFKWRSHETEKIMDAINTGMNINCNSAMQNQMKY